MASNFLEQLASEWFEYRGYFVRRNVLVGPRSAGGHESELDVVAFDPKERCLVHLEASMDAGSWQKREARFTKKFEAGRKYVPGLFKGIGAKGAVEQVALLAFASKKRREKLAGAKIVLVEELIAEIVAHFWNRPDRNIMVPEQFPILRTLQHVTAYWDTIVSRIEKPEE